jgi:hypothetical protein
MLTTKPSNNEFVIEMLKVTQIKIFLLHSIFPFLTLLNHSTLIDNKVDVGVERICEYIFQNLTISSFVSLKALEIH